MEVVTFDGKEYVKGSVVAERFRYTADYLGQLCRGKKIDARLIGRAWYVNIDSLHAHRDTRYKTSEKDPEANKVAINVVKEPRNHYLSRIDVEPILKKKTVSLYQQNQGKLAEVKVKYETDEYSLIPHVNKEAIFKRLPITPAESEELKITEKGGGNVRFKAEDLPEVYLRGRLKVSDASNIEEPKDTQSESVESESEVDDKIEPETKPQRLAPAVAVPGSRTIKVRSKNRKAVFQNTHAPVPKTPQTVAATISNPVSATAGAKMSIPISIIDPKVLTDRTPKLRSATPVFENKRFAADMRPKLAEGVLPMRPIDKNPTALVVSSFKPSTVMKKEDTKKPVSTSRGWALPVAIFVGGFVVGTALLGIESDVMASTQSSAEHFFFSTERIKAALNFISSN